MYNKKKRLERNYTQKININRKKDIYISFG